MAKTQPMSIWLITTSDRRIDKMDMYNPPHPGEIVREDCLKALDLTVTEAAKGLGVTRG